MRAAIRQPNGMFAIFSTVVDSFVAVNVRPADLRDWLPIPCESTSIPWDRRRWFEARRVIQRRHGVNHMRAIEAEIAGKFAYAKLVLRGAA